MRKSIDGLWAIIQENLRMDPYANSLYLFCGKRKDRMKALLYEIDGFVLLYKRLPGTGCYRWPRNQSEARNLTWREFKWLMQGLEIDQPKAIIPPSNLVDNLSNINTYFLRESYLMIH